MNSRFVRIAGASILIIIFFSLFTPPIFGADKRLAFLPLEIFSDESKSYLRQGLSTMFISRLEGGDIKIIPNDVVQSHLDESDKNGVGTLERAIELATQLKADYVIFGSVTSLGESYSLDLSVADLTKKEPVETRISEAVTEDQLIIRLSDIVFQFRAAIDGIDIRRQRIISGEAPSDESSRGLFFKPADEYYSFQPSGSLPIRLDLMAFDSGDLDGDGEAELVILDRYTLMVYAKKEGRFVMKDLLETSSGYEFLKVTVGDADENEKEELCVVSLDGLRAESTVWEWSGKFKKLYKMGGHLQIIASSGTAKPVVLFQDSNLRQFFYGKIKVMDMKDNGRLTPVEELELPEEVQFYTLTFFDLDGDAVTEIIGLGESGLKESAYLNIWQRDGKNVWRSDHRYGGTNNFITMGIESSYRDESSSRIALNCRPLIADIDGDGHNEVIVVTNIAPVDFLNNLRIFTKSKLTTFNIQGNSLSPKLTTREIQYCMVDMQMEKGTLLLGAQKPKVFKFATGSGRIMWFDY
ncbi:MAG: VCBS repeat-containing protein [Deltaproteobacteria bacterium]|nr:VCBS repeat-containing protein [Deltaproteobacteria bacterium]